MSARDPLAAQIANEMLVVAQPWGALLGMDILDAMTERLRSRSATLAAQLRAEDDDQAVAGAVSDVLSALWTGDVPDGWWRSPLGQACARSLGTSDAESVTHSVAAAMLGVHRGTVGQMVSRGTLDRHPDGGILRRSVLLRIANRG